MRASNANSPDTLKNDPLNNNKSARQTEPQSNSGQKTALPLTALGDCLVDADVASSARFGRGRRSALGVSALIQFCALCVLLIWPLFATGSRLIAKRTIVIPPFGGMPHSAPAPTPIHLAPVQDGGYHPQRNDHQIVAPTRVPAHVFDANDRDAGASAPPASNPGVSTGDYSGPIGLIQIPGTSSGSLPATPPTTAPIPDAPVPMSQGVVLAALIHRVEPAYPAIARQIHQEGVVELRAIIARDGTIQQLQIVSGPPILARAALDAVRQWRFRPTLLNGDPVEVDTYITVTFRLGQ